MHSEMRPDEILGCVWTADSCRSLASVEVRVAVTFQYKPPRCLIGWIIGTAIAHVGRSEQARHIGVIHQVRIAQSIHFVGVDLLMFREGYAPMVFDAATNLRGQHLRPLAQNFIAEGQCHWLSNATTAIMLDGTR